MFLKSFNISASALLAERIRMDILSSNLANINTTRTPYGGPYRRRDVIFSAIPIDGRNSIFQGVKVLSVILDPRPFKRIYNPSHPDADKDGYVLMPNVNLVEEMINMVEAQRAYEANITAIETTKDMLKRILEVMNR